MVDGGLAAERRGIGASGRGAAWRRRGKDAVQHSLASRADRLEREPRQRRRHDHRAGKHAPVAARRTSPGRGIIAKFKKLPKIAQPNKTFYDKGALDSGIRYGYISDAAHTDGDLYVYFPQQNVLAVGGAAYGQGWPVMDWWTGGWIGGIVGGLQRIQSVANKDTKIVPAVGPRAELSPISRTQVDMYGTHLRPAESDAEQRAIPRREGCRGQGRPRNTKTRWATRMSSSAALSRACGRIYLRMLEAPDA